MEGEINNFIMVWTTVICCLCYCHTVDGLFPKCSFTRFVAILPVFALFLVLPLNLTSLNLGGTSSFFIAWLASFKLILFAFRKGPLSSYPPLPLTSFILLACFPIKCHHKSAKSQPKEKTSTNHVTKLILLALIIHMYNYKEYIHQKILLLFYTLHIYFTLELLLVTASAVVRVGQLELEPPFKEPHLATSLQDFWGKRWNLIVTNILRPAVYEPVLALSSRLLPARFATFPAVMATFVVSGVMHELVFYNIGRAKPTGQVLSFFLVNGVCLVLEVKIKKALNRKFWLPGIVSGPLALAFVILTCFWLFLPPFLRNNADVKGCTETLAFIEFVKHHRLVSPHDLTCPFE